MKSIIRFLFLLRREIQSYLSGNLRSMRDSNCFNSFRWLMIHIIQSKSDHRQIDNEIIQVCFSMRHYWNCPIHSISPVCIIIGRSTCARLLHMNMTRYSLVCLFVYSFISLARSSVLGAWVGSMRMYPCMCIALVHRWAIDTDNNVNHLNNCIVQYAYRCYWWLVAAAVVGCRIVLYRFILVWCDE